MKVVILTEGGSEIGFGHIARCSSFFQAFREKGVEPEIIVSGDSSTDNFMKELPRKRCAWHDGNLAFFKDIQGADIVFIDSYRASAEIYSRIAGSVGVAVYIDDTVRIDYPPGIVVNGAIHALSMGYPERGTVRYLLGPQYQPMRSPFWDVGEKPIRESIESVLITFGGDDVRNLSPRILSIFTNGFPGIRKTIIMGAGSKDISEVRLHADNRTRILVNVDAELMRECMMETDIAVSAGGQTTFELARIGVPSVIIGVAENQRNNLEGWKEVGCFVIAGNWDRPDIVHEVTRCIRYIADRSTRIRMSAKGRAIVDGQGARRSGCRARRASGVRHRRHAAGRPRVVNIVMDHYGMC